MSKREPGGRLDPASIPESPDFCFEQCLWGGGLSRVAGVDEAGRGALAGPVMAAAVVLAADPGLLLLLKGVRDSKQMTPEQRLYWEAPIRMKAVSWGVGSASAEEIDGLGILPATRLAAQRALDGLSLSPEHVLLDYLFLPEYPIPQTALIHGDRRSLTIAAASVLAKTARDAFMKDMDLKFPGYGFFSHKGYGTVEHRLALSHLGASPIHRRTFRPVCDLSRTGT